jgi:dTDP-4-dehydrorhamnose reductase
MECNNVPMPSYTHDVAWATRQIVTAAPAVGVYHCVSSDATTWADLARELAKMLGVPGRSGARCVQRSSRARAS